MRYRIPHLLLFLPFALALFGLASSAPAPLSTTEDTIYRRQANGNSPTQPVVTQTVQTINTYVLGALFDGSLCTDLLLSGIVVVLRDPLLRHAL